MSKWSIYRCMKYWIENSSHEEYIISDGRSSFVVEQIVDTWTDREISILELGCNVGRNLHYLLEAGYSNLSGVDISPRTIPYREKEFPNLANVLVFYEGAIEEWSVRFADCQFDVVFTMAVLEHIHPDSEWVFPYIARVAKLGIVTVEDEATSAPRFFPRNYKTIFENLGWKETAYKECKDVPVLDGYLIRRFEREGGK